MDGAGRFDGLIPSCFVKIGSCVAGLFQRRLDRDLASRIPKKALILISDFWPGRRDNLRRNGHCGSGIEQSSKLCLDSGSIRQVKMRVPILCRQCI